MSNHSTVTIWHDPTGDFKKGATVSKDSIPGGRYSVSKSIMAWRAGTQFKFPDGTIKEWTKEGVLKEVVNE
jgi:hypothetical protein